ncbi:APC membrane recruitment protein 2-like [Cololabis saira]|uniref:APC membrane recruitment protein 2-like n=1 Tax=Cololabis saira TaxID=129043 RepID=UPI002AD5B3D9|nr:APC membrane recruitment protein 2-like [Cololabis saira]
MDVQTENTDPPPNESQPSGKIRKGFKLFGKRKPGNIFSIRNKGDGNKSPLIRSKTFEGLSETDSQPNKEKGQELSQGEREQAEDGTLEEDGALAAATARNSISSACSAKSLTFFSLLRGGRRGMGDSRVHTVSQPVGRQRRGLKGLFGNGKFRLKDKEDKEEAPPSPLLMSSRANSVEIIKEDLTLTPKCQPRALDSPETDSCEPVQSTEDSGAGSPPETWKRMEDAPPLPTSVPPLVPGDNSLSSLLADISSLLTFDSISGGGDIMADVEAEWGKASSPIRGAVTRIKTHPAPAISPPSAHLVRETLDSANVRGTEQLSADHQLARPHGTGGQGRQATPSKTTDVHNESQTILQEPSQEKKPPQVKASGLSKIPVVGGGKGGRISVRESQHVSEEPSREPTTSVVEEKPHFNSHDAGSKDKISTIEATMATAKPSQKESQQPQQSNLPTSSARDSKIPVKHGVQTHAVSQISQTKEPPRTKIPVSKVPVRKMVRCGIAA